MGDLEGNLILAGREVSQEAAEEAEFAHVKIVTIKCRGKGSGTHWVTLLMRVRAEVVAAATCVWMGVRGLGFGV